MRSSPGRIGCLWLLLVLVLFPVFSLQANQADQSTTLSGPAAIQRLYRQGDIHGAAGAARDALAACGRQFGDSDHHCFELAVTLANLLTEQGKTDAAEKLLRHHLSLVTTDANVTKLDVATALNSLGSIAYARGRHARAMSFYQRALDIYEQVLGPDTTETATLVNNMAALATEMGDYDRATGLYAEALQLARKKYGSEHREVAGILVNQSTVFYYQENFSGAEQALHRALAMQKKLLGAGHPDVADTMSNLGIFYCATGRSGEGTRYLLRALAIRKKTFGADHATVASVLNNLATCYQRNGALDLAEENYKKALRIQEKIYSGAHPALATTLNNLGALYEDEGLYEQAAGLYGRSLSILDKVYGKKHQRTLAALNNLAVFSFNLGRFEKAEKLFFKVLSLKEQLFAENSLKLATALNNIGVFLNLYDRKGNEKRIRDMLRRAIAIRTAKLGKDHRKTWACRENLAFFLLDQGQLSEALQIFKENNSQRGMGKYYLVTRRYEEAGKEFGKSLQLQSQRQEYLISDYLGLALAEEGLGRYGSAANHFKQAVRLIEEEWQSLDPARRGRFLDGFVGLGFRRIDAYEGLIRVLYKGKQADAPQKMLWYAEKIKARGLLSMLARRNFIDDHKLDPAMISAFEKSGRELSAVGRRLRVLQKKKGKAAAALRREAGELYRQARRTFADNLAAIQKQYPEFSGMVVPSDPAGAKQIQAMLPPESVLVEYYIGREEGYAWVLDKNTIHVQRLNVGEDALIRAVQALLDPASGAGQRGGKKVVLGQGTGPLRTAAILSQGEKAYLGRLRFLYDALIAPLQGRITGRHLIIVPHGVLHRVPFSALFNGEHYLLDSHAVVTLPSASVLKYILVKRNPDRGSLVAFADPLTSRGQLHYAEPEVRAIAGDFTANRLYLKKDASESRIKHLPMVPDVLHFACHAEFDQDRPLRSALLLSRDGKNDGRLEAGEIFDLNLRGVNLVVLSACDTAAAILRGGDDLVGLSRGFIYAGTPSLLASLWQVDDRSTELLMKKFYQNWRKGKMDKDEALRRAQLALMADERYSHPYYWAPFELIGDRL